eukprot:8136187-Karenia_brevis.AAC.1
MAVTIAASASAAAGAGCSCRLLLLLLASAVNAAAYCWLVHKSAWVCVCILATLSILHRPAVSHNRVRTPPPM